MHAVHHPVGLVDDLQEVGGPGSGGEVSVGSEPGLPLGGRATYQEAELPQAESRGLVNVVHQAPRSGHHYVSQAAEAVGSVEQRVAQQEPLTDPNAGSLQCQGPQVAEPTPCQPLQGSQSSRTYVFWTRVSCSLARDFCPVTRATRRGVASV